ncbi:MAG: uracil-DNA glycosylase [Chloroflexi bacterium]|nr:uracil-DNA glycosylase [Chloroflexota bacterium]
MKTLKTIRTEIQNCTACGLCQTRIQAVPGEGPANAQIVFIGEAPGAQEDKQGQPFVGRSGKLLDQLLTGIGLARTDVFITNVVKCRPPDNRNPRKKEIAACRPFLDQQLALIKPRLAITLGRFSLAQFAPDVRISDVHGQAQRLDDLVLYPVYHPAAAFHRLAWREALEEDFRRIPEILDAEGLGIETGSDQAGQLHLP